MLRSVEGEAVYAVNGARLQVNLISSHESIENRSLVGHNSRPLRSVSQNRVFSLLHRLRALTLA